MEVQNDEISLKELIDKGKEWWHYLLSQWKIILLAGIIGAALGLVPAYLSMIFLRLLKCVHNAFSRH